MNEQLNIQSAKQISLVELLAELHFQPAKIRGNDYWYRSPLREERTASFKVNRQKNIWYDFGTGEGGNIINFGVRFYHCNVSQLLDILGSKVFSFHPQNVQRQNPVAQTQPAFNAKEIRDIQSPQLIQYIQSRGIKLKTAQQFCKEVVLYNKKTNAEFVLLCLQNNSGGWELNAPNFKSCIAPKDYTFFNDDQSSVAVTEGVFDFLSAVQEKFISKQSNWLVLNSLSMAEKVKPILLQHDKVFLLLDNDTPAKNCTLTLQKYGKANNIVAENLATKYALYKDINEWLMNEKEQLSKKQIQQQKQEHKKLRFRW
ncbi:hypothetical protein A9P82_08875 [Arachidicoccus ginsenosidimutans]|uniref:CHC2 zinc finger domain-containing protein n=1 Tax=Arachidicoccus sp. BS20 TaxID=1850526 RepID=UPI0007F0B175|nr:CHC2 zinc finger domain-containing protein [Arachidicoccus sp. BS20]ANI89396.1 hypothetical protein A9P82_08875 [Arachidicoccus sp. BS20]